MNVLAVIAKKAPSLAPKLGRMGLKVQKHSPEILLGVGVVSTLAGTVLACKATLKVTDVLDETNELLETIEETEANTEEGVYSKEDAVKDRAVVYVQTGVQLAKLYLPAISTIGLGVACFVASHNIQHRRVAALGAAYKAVEYSFSNYRDRVVEKLGEEVERDLYFGAKENTVEVTETLKSGKEKKAKKKIKTVDLDRSLYARYFSAHTTSQWSRNRDSNLYFLKMHQSFFNDRLKYVGHVFLNEVYDALGFDRTKEGALVGWIYEGEGDGFIDFGILDYYYSGQTGNEYIFDGDGADLILDFNVDGVIFDKI